MPRYVDRVIHSIAKGYGGGKAGTSRAIATMKARGMLQRRNRGGHLIPTAKLRRATSRHRTTGRRIR